MKLVPGVDLKTRTMPNTEEGQAVQRVIDGLNKVKEATLELNKEANYYSKPVDNVIKFYDFKNYVPFKGKPGVEHVAFFGAVLHVSGHDRGLLNAALAPLRGAGGADIREAAPSLEDVFIHLQQPRAA